VELNFSTSAAPTAIATSLLRLSGPDTTVSRLELDAFGAQAFFTGACYGGTSASLTAVTSGSQCSGYNSYLYNGTSLVGPLISFRGYANQNQAVGSGGTYATISTTPNGSTTLTDVIKFENDGGITVPPTVTGGDQGAGTINAAGLYVNGVAVGAGGGGAITNFAYKTGAYYIVGGPTTIGATQNKIIYYPWVPRANGTVTSLNSILGSTVSASTTWCAAIYSSSAGLPASNLSGTSGCVTTSTTGVTVSTTISQAVTAGTLYWIGVSVNSATTTCQQYTVPGGSGNYGFSQMQDLVGGATVIGAITPASVGVSWYDTTNATSTSLPSTAGTLARMGTGANYPGCVVAFGF
jgi:hypothetical protein